VLPWLKPCFLLLWEINYVKLPKYLRSYIPSKAEESSANSKWSEKPFLIYLTGFEMALLGQHHQISQNRCCAGSTRIQGQVRWDWWGDCDWIQSGMVRGRLVEIGTSHQIWWNILREHNWGVPSAHIMFIYYVTYILEYLIMLWGCVCTGAYTIL